VSKSQLTAAQMQMARAERWLSAWYGARRWTFWLLPAMWLFIVLAALRRWWLCRYQQKKLATPLVVVGNISVGGTGKTPLLMTLVSFLQQQGFTPGVISRGYGGSAPSYPYLLDANSRALEAGDEPLSIFQRTGCAVCVGPDRLAAARRLEDEGCDILLSDDGLQHYRLGRHVEIAVVDGQRGLGNGFRLPVGPLREAAARLKQVDWVLVNSPRDDFYIPQLQDLLWLPMHIKPLRLVQLTTGNELSLTHFAGQQVQAVAGIGNPERFYQSLNQLGIAYTPRSFADHYAYSAEDLDFGGELPLIMTEKDSVKCRAFAQPHWYYLAVGAELPQSFLQGFLTKIKRIKASQASFLTKTSFRK
jgi:tetraacyldisaccharide 4'-kinase